VSEFVAPSSDRHPAEIYARLIQLPEHAHLKDFDAMVVFFLQVDREIKQGRVVLGAAHLPRVQGKLSGLFYSMLAERYGRLPDYIITLDHDYWMEESSEIEREALLYHELCHCVQAVDKDGEMRFDEAGNPVWALAPHDIEEFNLVVARYGAWSDDIKAFLGAHEKGRS
jgi:hypothetical protein